MARTREEQIAHFENQIIQDSMSIADIQKYQQYISILKTREEQEDGRARI